MTVGCACRILPISDRTVGEMQKPVEWTNPVIQCRITGFEYLLHDRLCRGRYFDLGSISYASFYEGGQRAWTVFTSFIFGALYRKICYNFSRSVMVLLNFINKI